jgi:hypothetical protein
MICRLCGGATQPLFQTTLLQRHVVQYEQCARCRFVQTEQPWWLEEAYRSPMNLTDTGVVDRNIRFARMAAVLLYWCFDRKGRYLDFAGGYGIFTRLMRDIGFDFYWEDPHTTNLVARGFEWHDNTSAPELITAFELLEHLTEPGKDIAALLARSRNLLFSTILVSDSPPAPESWWYYGREHGQHIALYTRRTLEVLAETHGLHLTTNGKDFHLLTEHRVSPLFFRQLRRMEKYGGFAVVKKFMNSRTVADMEQLIQHAPGEEHHT